MALVYLAGGLRPFENWLLDVRYRASTRPAESDVLLVDIDRRSLHRLDVWPWPRGYHATVVEVLLESGARSVGFDVDFSSRSPDSEQDLELAQTLAAAEGRVVLPVFDQWERVPGQRPLHAQVRPLPDLAAHARLGRINVLPDPDGVVRRYEVHGDGPSFAAALAGREDGPQGAFLVDFAVDPGSIPRISYVDVLTGTFDPQRVAGKAVIVGSSAAELGDMVAVPGFGVIPGPFLQALAYESLTTGRMLRPAPLLATLAITLALSFLAGTWVLHAPWRFALGTATISSLGALVLSLALQRFSPLVIEISPWLATIWGAYLLGLVRRIDQQSLRILFQRGRLERTETMMRHVVENSFDAIVTLRADGTLDTVNRAAREMFAYESQDVSGVEFSTWIRPVERADGSGLWTLRESRKPYEAMGCRANGSEFPVELTLSRFETAGQTRKVAFLRDITERKSQEQALLFQATHDALTGLPNRYLLEDRAEQALGRARTCGENVALLLLDLNRFKEINDALGHRTGDRLLKLLAERLRRPLRDDDCIARLGGDEFAVLLPGSPQATAEDVAKRLSGALEEPFVLDGLKLQIDTSIGVAVFPEHGATAEELIQRADVAMYVAKRARSGVGVYDPDQDRASIQQLTLTGELRNALRDNTGLALHYQPKIVAGTGQMIGVEALIRWNHPTLGWIRPDQLIQLAENTGLIQPVTRWVLQTALTQCASWLAAGMRLSVAVNVSARNLLEAELPEALRALLREARVPAQMLTLEITESAIMEDPVRALAIVRELQQVGVAIAIDDFGTGYSSLAYLKKLPASELKIDRSFVMEMDRDEEDAAIVRSTIDLAHNMGLKVVAEGVETDEVWLTLQMLGCDFGQGYLFSKPLPPAELDRWIRESAEHAGREPAGMLDTQALIGSQRPS